jgi:hypothetical protein
MLHQLRNTHLVDAIPLEATIVATLLEREKNSNTKTHMHEKKRAQFNTKQNETYH